tara:strand:- start:785 stop:1678 length:894 start_codon:yes stop_codon:yes gene_type:complete
VTTFDQMIEQTIMYMNGFSTVQDQSTHLTQPATDSDTTLTVANTQAVSRGLVEIGDELIWVDDVDKVATTLTVPPYGRGFRGSTAAAHASGTRVISAPLFPRSLVKQAINESITAVFPDLWAVGTTTIAYTAAKTTYPLPAGVKEILSVTWSTTGPTKEWLPVRRWRLDRNANTTSFANGTSLSVYDAILPGRTLQVVYTTVPTQMTNGSDVFSTVTGLPDSTQDVIRLGAAYRMVPFFDAAHLSGMSAEADVAAQQLRGNQSTQLGRYFTQMYQMRLAEEAQSLQRIYPTRSHYTR